MRGRAGRAEQQADAYRAELDRLRASPSAPEPAGPPAKPAARPPAQADGRPASEALRAGAPRHWCAYLLGGYGSLEDPEEFFTEVGEQAGAETEDRYLE